MCWNITNKCNINCKHCFRNLVEKELTYKQNLIILKKLKSLGIKRINWSGGEFFLYKDYLKLLKIAKKLKFKCSLTTNALLLTPKIIDKIIKYIDYITFSIEFVDDEDNENFGRGKAYIPNLIKTIEYINNKYPHFKIKINTVVMKQNIDKLPDIYLTLKKHKIYHWKFIEFCPFRTQDKDKIDNMSITLNQFEDVVDKYSQLEFTTTFNKRKDMENQLVVSPSGNLVMSRKNADIVLIDELFE